MPLAPIEIARLEETRQARSVGEIADTREAIAGGVMAFTAPGAWSNQAVGLGLEGPVSDVELDRFVDFYVRRGVEPQIEVCPFAHDSLVKGLAARGFRLREFGNVLAKDLTHDDTHAPPSLAGGMKIHRLDPGDEPLLLAYTDIAISCFLPPDVSPDDHFRESIRRSVVHPRSTTFLAMFDGKPQGGGGMEVAQLDTGVRTSCLFGAGVTPEYRRRGAQLALIAARVHEARRQGASLVCIQSRPGIATERNAMRLGFQVAYTKVVMTLPGDGLTPSP